MNIIELAKQAHGPITSRWWDMDVAALERFADLVRAQTLEEAAAVCDVTERYEDWEILGGKEGKELCSALAAAIRALMKEKT